MNFEKKYWSTNEYKDNSGNEFTGFVGILDGVAYDIASESLLSKNDNYVTHINCSSKNYDRVLSKELKLPYAKSDILFAANDFLSGSAFKTIVNRLQTNNDYLFKNSIISNSNLPTTDECIIFSSIAGEDGKIAESESGKLRKFNFSNHALQTKTAIDPTFYPETEERIRYYVYNKLGEKLEIADDKTKFIEGGKTYDEIDEAEDQAKLKERWQKYNGNLEQNDIDFDSIGEIQKDEVEFYLYNDIDIKNNKINKNIVLSGNLEGEYDTYCIFPEDLESNKFEINFTSDVITNLVETYGDNNEDINFAVSSISFIIKGDVPEKLSLLKITKNSDNNVEESWLTSSYIQKYAINEDFTYVIYNFNLEKNDINLFPSSYNDDLQKIEYSLFIKVDKKTEFLCTPDKSKKIKNIVKYQIGTEDVSNTKKIENIERYVDYSFIWLSDGSDEGAIVEHIAEPNFSYKFLIESDDWLAATNPRLKYTSWTDWNDINQFIPNETMTAADVYQYMINEPKLYYFPAVYRKSVKYESLGIIGNPKFKEAVYPINSYQFETDEEGVSKVVVGFKSAIDIYNDLNIDISTGLPSTDNTINCVKDLYDKIPEISKEYYIITVNENKVLHNFNEIQASQIIARDFNKDERSCNLIIFLLFKTKVLIFQTKYFYNNISEGLKESGQNYIKDIKNEINNENFILDLSKSGNWFEIANINPGDNNSLKFLNLNAIKVYKNMLYLVDSQLDMVLRYSIDYLVSSDENLSSAFNKNSIRLLDIMQGKGDNKDKIYFNKPYSIDVSDSGVYIVDRNNSCVKSYTHGLNYKKTLKNGFFSNHDIQAVAINPYPCIINDIKIKKDSIWIASVLGDRIFLSILENDIVKVYGQIEDIVLLQDEYTWIEEIRGIHFSKVHSNYFYLNTSKRTYKFHVSEPLYPYASLSYYKQRSLIGDMRWISMRYPWHKVPSLYSISNLGSEEIIKNEVTWDYQIPTSSAEILDNKCFCLTGNDLVEGDIIFHFTVLYDNSKIRKYINENKLKFDNKMTFYDIESGLLAQMIKSSSMLLYAEPDSFISSLSSNNMPIYNIEKIEGLMNEDYINPITFNKVFYSLIHNLLNIKNSLIGKFRAATNLDGVIVYDNIILDDYFNNLELENTANYFIHENEHLSIIVNRILEEIIDIQEKIITKMQTEFIAAQSYVNNTSRYI